VQVCEYLVEVAVTADTTSADSSLANLVVRGTLHCVVSFDWGDEVNLELAAQLEPSEASPLPRRPRTPAAIAYRPAPLSFNLGRVQLPIAQFAEPAEVEAIVFDFGAANVAFRAPFELTALQLADVAASLADQQWLLTLARQTATPLFEQLLPAIDAPGWSESYEDYFTFQLEPQDAIFGAGQLRDSCRNWLVSLLRLETTPLSDEEIREALRCQISYGRNDCTFIDWSAAVVIDRDCAETLHTIDFANLQLLEFRFLDQKVDAVLHLAREQIQSAAHSWLPFWRTHAVPLRLLAEIRMDTVGTFERANSALQLVGDQYLSRLYRLLSDRFHLTEWAGNVRQAIDVAADVHETLSSQSAMFRLELLEITVVALILLEIVLALVGH
jgi:hypothetical protein